MNKFLKWPWMLTKRLYKKASFIIILLLIPLCVSIFTSVAQREKGFLHVILVQTNPNDKISAEIISDLTSTSSVVRFSTSTSAEKATESVQTGNADEAWIFSADTEGNIQKYIETGMGGFISIIAREKTVFSMLSREKLSSAVFEYTAKAYYLDFVRTQVPELDSLSDDELIHYFETVSIDEELFVFSEFSSSSSEKVNYLTSPIRGFLGILIMICGMAAALYLMQDERSGTFSWASDKLKLPIGFGSMLIAVLNTGIAAIVSLCLSQLSTNCGRELLVTLLYCFCCVSFCLLLKLILSSIKLYAATIPLMSIISLVVCPVFFNLNTKLCYIMPPTYYTNAIYSNEHILYMIVYTLVCITLCLLLNLVKNKRINRFRTDA